MARIEVVAGRDPNYPIEIQYVGNARRWLALTVDEANDVLRGLLASRLSSQDVKEAANKLYPPNHPVDDPEGETGEAQSDPYGYDETGNRAFLEGAAWQATQLDAMMRRMGDIVDEWRLGQ